jgi:hypothetical protein
LTAFLFGCIGVLFWNMFGETLKWAYGEYLKKHVVKYVHPVMEKHVTPHFTALWDVMREKAPVLEKVKGMFSYRDVNLTAAAAGAAKEL